MVVGIEPRIFRLQGDYSTELTRPRECILKKYDPSFYYNLPIFLTGFSRFCFGFQ